jgi:hypothetical protein
MRRCGDDHRVQHVGYLVQTRCARDHGVSLLGLPKCVRTILDHRHVKARKSGENTNVVAPPIAIADHADPDVAVREADVRPCGVGAAVRCGSPFRAGMTFRCVTAADKVCP